ncbi:hypothetical protein [Salipiger thiooxidans]|uniref:hypothetical protein n=1 Tax=Salipiger thiooxidans TaxID=282683 RepID=UPI001CF9ECDB|nr:hypothetical protein [Salipiger thiooxidans]
MNHREIELERQLVELRKAAVEIMLEMAHGIASTPAAREELAQGFEEAAGVGISEKQRLARLVAAALRR